MRPRGRSRPQCRAARPLGGRRRPEHLISPSSEACAASSTSAANRRSSPAGARRLDSAEFAARFPTAAGPDNGAHVEQLHLNVLDRPSDAEGKAKWVNALAAGTRDRADVLLEFSEGLENVASMRGKVRPACDGSTNKRPRSRASTTPCSAARRTRAGPVSWVGVMEGLGKATPPGWRSGRRPFPEDVAQRGRGAVLRKPRARCPLGSAHRRRHLVRVTGGREPA